ncbi:D-alanyl-D-alanine carboxypeptidase/D-alanyl-D-alanine-endopeptidase [candidate division KSB1 bacterium]|nr:D-alanyl-D-alanine carboxypeptidase/D-alanyl-D-alanine-endopeptidase [candidate division KSB1 bacterium]
MKCYCREITVKGFSNGILIFGLLLLNGCYFNGVRENRCIDNLERLQSELNTIFDDPEFYNAHWGVVIQSLETGENIYLKNENKNFMPASNMKLFTTAVALLKLRPDFKYRTHLFHNGTVVDGILNGDLIIQGSGDPSFTSRYHDGNIVGIFEQWADSLKKSGIHAIEGDIVGDDNFFDEEIMGDGWAWDYQSDWYAAQISALSFNDNCMDILFTPGDSVGAPANYRLEPETDFVEIINHVTTVGPEKETAIYYNRLRGTNRVVISGRMAIDTTEKRDWFSIENPTLYTTTILKQVLEQNGIIVSGVPRDIDHCEPDEFAEEDLIRVFVHESPPLWKIVNTINKVSQNLYAELLLRTLGAELKQQGNAEGGIQVVKETIPDMGINPVNFVMVDGSGLSRLNLITPRQITQLLRYMHESPANKFFYNSLPTAGVDGSLKHRMKNTSAKGKVIAKTGYLGHAVALSGYLRTGENEECVFSLITNNFTAPTSLAHQVQDAACERLTSFVRILRR